MKNNNYVMGLLSCNLDNYKMDDVLINDLYRIYGFRANFIDYLREEVKYEAGCDEGFKDYLRGIFDEEMRDKSFKDYLRGIFDVEGSIIDNILGLDKRLIELYSYIGYDVKQFIGEEKKHSGIDKAFLNIVGNLYSHGGFFNSQKYEDYINATRLTPDEIMMEAAHLFSKRSPCIRRKVGCVITNCEKTNIISIGYNGGVKGGRNCCESSLEGACGCVHAEENALLKGVGSNLYCTTLPCVKCAKLIINAGIQHVFYDCDYRQTYSLAMFDKSGISYEKICRGNYYWKC
jgi:dCMP deaminase